MNRLIAIAAVAACLIAGLACGDDDASAPDSPELAGFFADLQDLTNDSRASIDDLGDIYPDAFKGDVEQTRDAYAEYVPIFDSFNERAAPLEAPEEVSDLFDELKAINESMSVVHHERLDRLQDATTVEEIDAIFGPDEAYDGYFQRGTEVCLELTSIADDHNIEYDVPCGE